MSIANLGAGGPASVGPAQAAAPPRAGFWGATLGSIGVVYGDIGTSPLYAFREAVAAAAGHGAVPGRETVIGVLSLILWALILVVTIKYVIFVLRADNNGEGGTLSLMALAAQRLPAGRTWLLVVGVAGVSLFYGDSVITPAISVLSAVEGLKVAAPRLSDWVVPITIGILAGLFAVQARGTARVGAFFGPVMVVWFLVLAVTGAMHIFDDPDVFRAFNPVHGLTLVAQAPHLGVMTLGAVFLAVTGAEALYADLGHFGRKPIRAAWLGLFFRRLRSTISGRRGWCSPIRKRSRIRSSCSCPRPFCRA